MGFTSGYIVGRLITADIISFLSGIFRLIFALLKLVFRLIKRIFTALHHVITTQGSRNQQISHRTYNSSNARQNVSNSESSEAINDYQNLAYKLKPLRGLGLFLLINGVAYGLALAGVGTGSVAGLVYILIFIGSLVFCFRMTINDVRARVRERKEARFNRNFEQACKEVTDIVHLTPIGSCTFQEHFKIWDDYADRLFDSVTDFIYSKKGFLGRYIYKQPVPTCATLVNRLTKMVEGAQTLHISERERLISFNCGQPVRFNDIIETKVVTETDTRRGTAYTYRTSNRAYTKTYATTDKTYTRYSIMIYFNRLTHSFQQLSFGLNREIAYETDSLIKALKYR